ncbi:MAG: chemotaxis protein CheA [Thermoleophilia bacterium]|nr:chemotaxis protein CheA [Thermoleophilia bacterium]
MNQNNDREIFSAFLDDYFAECDEHLSYIKRMIVDLAGSESATPTASEAFVSELLRRFHTIKGLSMMVGFSEAGDLAHKVESYLRSLGSGEVAFRTETLGALTDAVKLLEQALTARKRGESVDIADLAASVVSALETPVEEETQSSIQEPEAEAKNKQGKPESQVYLFKFVPSQELAQQGVNVETVRETLKANGEILSAYPIIEEGGAVAFHFKVRLSGDVSEIPELAELGLSWSKADDRESDVSKVSSQAERPTPAGKGTVRQEQFSPVAPSALVRVELSRLDELMRMCGELVLTRNRLDSSLKQLRGKIEAAEWQTLQQHSATLERQVRALREAVMRARMVPIGEIFERLKFAVYDLAREENKLVRVITEGSDAEIDKLVVERLLDPLLHLVRNAVAHGIETPGERAKAGKPEQATVMLRARAMGEVIVISVADDGAGIDEALVRRRAAEAGLLKLDEPLDADQLLDILTASGFSTRTEADLAGGRGVGLTIVRETVEQLGGELSLATTLGKGTEFILQLPLSLSIVDAVIARAGDQVFAVPLLSLREIVEVQKEAIVDFEGTKMISHRDTILPLLDLGEIYQLRPASAQVRHALVVGAHPHWAGLLVDRVLGSQEIVVHATPDPLLRIPGIAGASETGAGQVVLIVDPLGLVRWARAARGSSLLDNLATLEAQGDPGLEVADA